MLIRPCASRPGACRSSASRASAAAVWTYCPRLGRPLHIQVEAYAVGGEGKRKVPLAVHTRALEAEHAVEDGRLLLRQTCIVALALGRAAGGGRVQVGGGHLATRFDRAGVPHCAHHVHGFEEAVRLGFGVACTHVSQTRTTNVESVCMCM